MDIYYYTTLRISTTTKRTDSTIVRACMDNPCSSFILLFWVVYCKLNQIRVGVIAWWWFEQRRSGFGLRPWTWFQSTKQQQGSVLSKSNNNRGPSYRIKDNTLPNRASSQPWELWGSFPAFVASSRIRKFFHLSLNAPLLPTYTKCLYNHLFYRTLIYLRGFLCPFESYWESI